MQDGYSIEAFDTTEAPRVTALAELIEMIEAFDEHPDPSDEGDVRELLSRPHFEASNDLVVAMSGDALIGWAAAVSRPSSVRFVRSGLRGGVHPAHRRSGVGSALLAWSEQRGRGQMAAADPSLPRWLAVEVLESQSSLRRLAHQHGFEERRWFIDMKRRLDALPEPVEPDGIQIVPWADEFADQVLLADTQAFADHWGSTPLDPETWNHVLTAPGTRLDLSFIALDGDKVVAYSFNQAWPDEAETARVFGCRQRVTACAAHDYSKIRRPHWFGDWKIGFALA